MRAVLGASVSSRLLRLSRDVGILDLTATGTGMQRESFKVRDGQRPDGVYRIRSEPDVFRLIGDIESYMAGTRAQVHHRDSTLSRVYEGLKEALRGMRRPSDRYLSDPLSHSVDDDLRQRDGERYPGYNRIMVTSTMTSAGNLSVTFSPWYLNKAGRWQNAEEWARLDGFGNSKPMQRPNNEVLFIKGARDLMEGIHEHSLVVYGERDDWKTEAWLATRAVMAAYEIVVDRLRENFGVLEDDVPVGLASDPKAENGVYALEMVDGLKEYRAEVAKVPERLKAETGIDPDALWHLYQEKVQVTHQHRACEAVSRKLRTKEGPMSGFTPETARRWVVELERAVNYRVWAPAPPKPVEDVPVEREAPVRQERERPFHDRRKRHVEVQPSTGPRYPTKGIPLPDEVKEEFGVDDAHALVVKLNEAREANGERSIPQGDFPTNKPNLVRVVRDLQRLRDEGLLVEARPRP